MTVKSKMFLKFKRMLENKQLKIEIVYILSSPAIHCDEKGNINDASHSGWLVKLVQMRQK